MGYAGPAYPDSLGIDSANWYGNGGASDVSPDTQIAVAERLERFARSVGLGERVVAKQAITEYLDRHDPETKEQDHGHQA